VPAFPINARLHRVAELTRPGVRSLLLAALTASIVPFFLLLQYTHPSADDFCYASTFGRGDAWADFRGEYLGWKGRYSAIILTVLYHHAGGMLVSYGYALFAYLAALAVAVYAFVHALTEGSGSRLRTLFLAVGFLALYLATMPKVPATVYWLDGAFQYQTGIIFVLLAAAALWHLYRRNTASSALLACLFIFVAIGATETAMITLAAIVSLMAFNRLFVHPRGRAPWTVVVLVTVASSLLLTLAPGNFVRADLASPDAGRLWFSFSHAWHDGGRTLADWITDPLLWLATAVFTPIALRMVHLENVRPDGGWLRFTLTLLLIPGLVWTLFFAMWWAAATNPPGRMLNMMHLVFLATWFSAVLELVAASTRGGLALTERLLPTPLRLALSGAAVVLAALVLLHGHARTAWADLLYRAPGYDRVMQDRYARIAAQKARSDEERPDMTLPGVPDPPRFLMYGDIQANPRDFRNTCFARYFGLGSVARQ